MAPDVRRLCLIFGVFAVTLLAAYFPTIRYPYVLADEGWILTESGPFWGYGFGRPLFSVLSWPFTKLFGWYGLDAIYLMRLSSIVGLAAFGTVMALWFQLWGTELRPACLMSIVLLTLPPYQIIVAGGTQLATALFFSASATYWFFKRFDSGLGTYCVSGALLLLSLLIYQQQMLVSFAMLVVPLLASRHLGRPFCCHVGFLVCISLGYFGAWKLLVVLFQTGYTDLRYGPTAVRLPDFDDLRVFLDCRLPQVLNLWSVEQPQYRHLAKAVMLGTAAAFGIGMVRSRTSVWCILVFPALVVLSDGFRIMADAYPSYITATALSLVLLYPTLHLAGLLGRGGLPVCLATAVFGCFMAHATVQGQVAKPNFLHMQQIRNAFRANPSASEFCIFGTSGGLKYQEFGWRNAATGAYLRLVAQKVAYDMERRELMSPAARERLHIIVRIPEVSTSEAWFPGVCPPGAVAIHLDNL